MTMITGYEVTAVPKLDWRTAIAVLLG